MWTTILVIAVVGGMLWALERYLARKDAEAQEHERHQARVAAHRAQARAKAQEELRKVHVRYPRKDM